MGENQVPQLDFHDIEQEGVFVEDFKVKLKEACEKYGCFLLKCKKFFPMCLREDSFKAMKELFDLPQETKQRYKSHDDVYSGYISHPQLPLFENFGVFGAYRADVAQAFTELMWPHGNPSFFNVVRLTSSKMMEMNLVIMKMIRESLRVNDCDGWNSDNTNGIFRLIKYKVPQSHDPTVALVPHFDSSIITILCENDVQGLEVLSKQGNYMEITIPKGCSLVIVGELLKAWSNGRLHATKHRVTMKGDKERFSCGLFSVPKPEEIIQVPRKLVDDDHPLRYRPFTFSEYMSLYTSSKVGEAIEKFSLL